MAKSKPIVYLSKKTSAYHAKMARCLAEPFATNETKSFAEISLNFLIYNLKIAMKNIDSYRRGDLEKSLIYEKHEIIQFQVHKLCPPSIVLFDNNHQLFTIDEKIIFELSTNEKTRQKFERGRLRKCQL